MATVGLPLTGAGDATAQVAVDLIGVEVYQRMKLHDGADGSTMPLRILGTTPGSSDGGMVTRPIGSTAFNQAVVGAVGLTSGSSAVGITSGSSAVELTSAGSTRLAGRFDVNNPTTAVSLSSQHTFTLGNPTSAVDLSSGGSTKVIGTVNATGTTKVDVSSGVVLGAGSSANMLGQVFATGTTKVDVSSGVVLGAGSTGNALGAVALLAGTSANIVGTVAITGGTSANTLGSVALVAGSSGNVIGAAAQGPGSSANAWFQQSVPYSSGGVARTTVNTSVDASVIAANASRKALVIGSLSTAQICALGLTTAAVTTALANVHIYLQPNSQLVFGMPGGLPLYTGPIRGINISSTAVGGGVAVMEFS